MVPGPAAVYARHCCPLSAPFLARTGGVEPHATSPAGRRLAKVPVFAYPCLQTASFPGNGVGRGVTLL